MQKTLLFTLLFICRAIYAQSFIDQVIPWEGKGFGKEESCSIYKDDLPKGISPAWIKGFELETFLPLSLNNQAISLKLSQWQLATTDDQVYKASCERLQPHLLIEVIPRASDSILIGVRVDEIASLEAFLEETESALLNRNRFKTITGVQIMDGSSQQLVCTASSQLNVRDETLEKTIFQADQFENVLPVQSFDAEEKQTVVGGKLYTFIHVQFPERNNQRGWVANAFISTAANCPSYKKDFEPLPVGNWRFPTLKRPTHNYKSGMRRFKARRGGGSRYHAASDLYRVLNEEVKSVNNGKIIRDIYYFYQGTYAIEVRHSDGRIARYGEITGRRAAGVGMNKSLKTGQTIGYVGKVNSGCCNPMLHFELYSGEGTGPLTQSGNKFRRRWDLQDPSRELTNWEFQTFGESF